MTKQRTVMHVYISSLTPEIINQVRAIAGVQVAENTTFAELTTLHIGGRPRLTLRCATAEAIVDVVRTLDAAQVPLLLVGGGSNLVIADGEIDVVAVILANDEIAIDGATLRAGAGTVWDEVVQAAIQAGLGGLECLSGIPGSAGATPVQNVGAYGAEIADVLTRVRLLDRESGQVRWEPAEMLELSYRYSNLKFTNRAVVLEVEYRLREDGLSAPLRFGELARRLGAESAETRFPAAVVREEVLNLRRGKGMVYDPADHDTWSAGSFFTNPIVDSALATRVQQISGEEKMPRFPVAEGPSGEGKEKLSAAWLIERAGFPRGYRRGQVGLSTRHTLALTNRGQARAEELQALAREIRDGVQKRFGVQLVPEPVWVGMSIDD